MKNEKLFLILAIVVGIAMIAFPVMAQEAVVPTEQPAEAVAVAPVVEAVVPVAEEAPVVAETVEVAAEEVAGEVVSIDAEKSVLVLKYVVDKELNIQKEESFDVSTTTEIKKGENLIALTDIVAGDMATVKSMMDADGKKVVSAINIAVKAE